MSWYLWLLGGLLIAASLFLIIVVLLQESKSAGLSGAISGGADTFFGKNKGRTMEAKLIKMTKIVATLFVILAIVTTFMLLFVFNK